MHPSTDPRIEGYLQRRGVEEKWIELRHGTARYLERPGDGPAVIMLHGFSYPSGAERLLPVMPIVGRHFHTYSLDLLGYGPGDRPRFEFSSAAHIVDGVREFMNKKEIGRCFLIGHCLGGRMALQLTYESPDRILGAVIAAISTRSTPQTLLTPATFRVPPNFARLLAGTKHQMDNAPGIDFEEMSVWGWRNIGRPGMEEIYRRWLNHFQDPSQQVQSDLKRQRWSTVKTPILLAWPDADPVGPVEDGVAIHGCIPSSRMVMCKGNHFFVNQYADDFAELCLSFCLQHRQS